MNELGLFLFGGQLIPFDGTYRTAKKRLNTNQQNDEKPIIGYLEINFKTGEILTYDSKGNLDNPQQI